MRHKPHNPYSDYLGPTFDVERGGGHREQGSRLGVLRGAGFGLVRAWGFRFRVEGLGLRV